MKKQLINAITIATLGVGVVAVPAAFAATTTNSQLTQSITAGSLSTSILDSTGAAVSSPSFAMSAVNSSTTSVQTSTGTFGSDSQRITVDNPGAGTNGWTLALAGATSAAWTAGTQAYPYDAATSAAGQLSITSAGTVTPVVGGSTGITGAVSGTFDGTVTSLTLMSAGATAASTWNGYVTGIGLSQTIPAGTQVGSYAIDMVQTVTAV